MSVVFQNFQTCRTMLNAALAVAPAAVQAPMQIGDVHAAQAARPGLGREDPTPPCRPIAFARLCTHWHWADAAMLHII